MNELTFSQAEVLEHVGRRNEIGQPSILTGEVINELVMARLLNRSRARACGDGPWVYPLTLTPKGREVLEGKS